MKLGVTLDILNQKDTPAFYADTLANRPAAGFTGRVFISTDTLDLYRDTGTTWVLLSPSSTGTITGSGAAGQVTYFSAASSITGSNNLFWDSVNNRLGINTNTPAHPLDVHSALSTGITLNSTLAGNDNRIAFQNSGIANWRIGNFYNLGTNDFEIYDALLNLPRISVKSTTGQVVIGSTTPSSGLLVVNSSTSDNHIVAIGGNAPSIRVRNAGTAPTLEFGLGLSTSLDNFIQGAVSGDFCIFNRSNTASPILFGIYNSVSGFVEEGARLSSAKNFLIGTKVDTGQKLIVSGTGLFSSDLTGQNIKSTSSTTFSYLWIDNVTANAANRNWALITNATNFGDFTIRQSNAANGSPITGTDRFYISPSGNTILGGTTDAGQKLQVAGDVAIENLSIQLNLVYSGATKTTFRCDSGGGLLVNTASGYIINYIGGVERMRIKTNTINISSIPTSSAGLVSGDIYSNLGVLTIVP